MSNGVSRLALVVAVLGGACSKADEGLTQRLMDANDKVVACQKEVAGLKSQVA
jgi:hypothetical protein